MYEIVLVVDVLSAIVVIISVLLQQGKGANMGVSLGAGSSNSFFGSKGSASFLFNVTVVFTAIFLCCCLMLGYLGKSPVTLRLDNVADNNKQSISSQYDKYQKDISNI